MKQMTRLERDKRRFVLKCLHHRALLIERIRYLESVARYDVEMKQLLVDARCSLTLIDAELQLVGHTLH